MTIKNNYNYKDLITNIFCIIDDLLKIMCRIGKRVWRKSYLSPSEIISINIFGKILWFKTLKQIYWHIKNYHFKDFIKIPDYKNFVELTNKYSNEALICLSILMNFNWKNTSNQRLYFIDSTCIAVCKNKRIFNHKVCTWFAERWKSTMWWFYWFKLHIITDIDGNLIQVKVTTWNTDDRTPVLSLAKKLTWILIWDTWYVSELLREKLLKQWLQFLTWVRWNMKKLMTEWQHGLLKARQIVETSFSVLKWSNELVSSLSRSVNWHFARIIYTLLTYTVWKSLDRELLWIS